MASRNITLDKVEVAVCALLLLAMVVTFGQTVCHEFVNFDDNEYVFENSHVSRGLTASGIVWAFTQGEQANWIPFTWLSLMIDCQLYDLHAGGHHLTNVLLHTATAMLLFLVLRRMTGRLWPSAFAAALFAVHPLRAESVAWVTERKDVLSGLCFMLTLGAYLGYVRHQFSWARYALLLVVFALGLMAKPMLVTLPFVLFLLDYWPFHRLALAWRIVIEKLPLIVLAAASCTVTFWAQRGAMLPQDRLPVAGRMVNALVSYAAYLVQFFYPAGLAAFYPHSGPYLSSTHVVVAAVVLAGVSVGTLACRQRCPYALVGWLWYVGMLVPVVGLVQVGSQAMADRYTYLPQIGLGIALAWGTADICRAWPSRRWACGLASASLLAALMGCAFRQTSFWCDSETLWTRALAVTSHNAMAQNGLGDALASDGRLEEGTEHFRRAVAISPYVVMFRMNLGAACLEAGQSQQAMEQFRQALALDADCAEAHDRLGTLLAGRGRLDEAAAHFRRSLDINPDNSDTCYDLGKILLKRGQRDEAQKLFQKAAEITPDYAAVHDHLGMAMAERRRWNEAIKHFQRALDGNPQCRSARLNLGKALAACGRVEEAIAQYRTVLRLHPDDAEARDQLAGLLARKSLPAPAATQQGTP